MHTFLIGPDSPGPARQSQQGANDQQCSSTNTVPHPDLQPEEQFRLLIEFSTDIILLLNDQGKILFGSPSIENHFGVPPSEYSGAHVLTYVQEAYHPYITGKLSDLLQRPGEPIFIRTLIIRKDGIQRWVEGTAINLLHKEGIGGIVCNLRDITEKVLAENKLMEEKIVRQKEIIQASIEAQEKERAEIGRELHDNVTQILTTARLLLSCVEDDLPTPDELMIARTSNIIASAIEEIRKLSKSLTQSYHREVGLQLCLEDLVESIRLLKKYDIELVFNIADEQPLHDNLKMAIFRIVQEQLNNVLKHAEASAIRISVSQEDEIVEVTIADDGKGFDVTEKRQGIGIANIITRADIFNGHVAIESAPGKGCTMTVVFKAA